MKLYIMRHGPAEDFSPSGRDADRALTPSGRDRVRDVARALLEADEAPHVIFTSPLVRALQTAELVATTLGTPPIETSSALAPGGPAKDLVLELARAGRKRVMVVVTSRISRASWRGSYAAGSRTTCSRPWWWGSR